MTGTQHVNDDQNQVETLNNNSNMKTKRKKLLTIVAVIIIVMLGEEENYVQVMGLDYRNLRQTMPSP